MTIPDHAGPLRRALRTGGPGPAGEVGGPGRSTCGSAERAAGSLPLVVLLAFIAAQL